MVLAKKYKGIVFSYKKVISNLSIGAAERLLNIWLAGVFYFVFQYVYNHFSLFAIPVTWYTWVLLLLMTDLVWYWYHRLGHEINILWAFHIVHHQSEDFNYTTSTRITVFQALIRNVFWCFLPFIGFAPEMVIITLVIHGAYSFFTHTELIHKMGWLEKIFITPSHHRVHHASNPEYLDKNYGDLFVFWDKLFGTFKEEEHRPVYGLTKPLKSYSFLWQHFHYIIEMLYRIDRTKGFINKLKIVFGKPEIMNGDERDIVESNWLPPIQQIPTIERRSGRYKCYINIQFLAVLAGIVLLTNFKDSVSGMTAAFCSIFILLTLINCCALLEQKKWIFFVEYVRMILFFLFSALQFQQVQYIILCSAVIVVCTAGYNTLRKVYIRLVYNSSY
ncbi:MAG: sterol desaturase family protein [Cytophagales bacterium]|nr:sterol desaturase family protein [Cytophaga sp.]